jgi:hypothetical protein
MTPNRLHSQQASRFNFAGTPSAGTAGDGNASNAAAASFDLRFRSLFDEERGYAFPCDAVGHVDLDALGDKARNSYFYAHTLIGREFSVPTVQPSALH